MTILIGDDRACARALTDLMFAKPDPDQKADRQQGPAEKAYVFGHYDSRGGAALVIASNHIEAIKKYCKAFFCIDTDDEPDKELASDHIDMAQEDFLFRADVVCCDAPLPADGIELDADYDGEFRYGMIQSRYDQSRYDPTTKFSEWADQNILVLWKGETPPQMTGLRQSILKEEFRLERLELGEDACGLVVVR